MDQNMPRPEYADGKKKLSYFHTFSTGHTIEVAENGKGVARFYLELPGKQRVNMAEEAFYPDNLKLVTPTYAHKHNLRNGWTENGYWYANAGCISVGDMKNPESVFILLHELGHLQPELLVKLAKIDNGAAPEASINEARYQSANERGAWAMALKIARHLKNKYGVNLMEIFPSLDSFHAFMSGSLAVHRYSHEFDIKALGKEVLSDEGINEQLRSLFDQPKRSMARKLAA